MITVLMNCKFQKIVKTQFIKYCVEKIAFSSLNNKAE